MASRFVLVYAQTHIRARGAFHFTTNACHFLTGDHQQKKPRLADTKPG
jgi:hypothetical protein